MKLFDRTEQQMFDEVVAHARKYQDQSAKRILIVALISDQDYHPEMENRNDAHSLARYFKDRVGESTIRKINLAENLQIAHELALVENWEKEFKAIAKKYNLIYTPPQEIRDEAV